MYTPTRMCAVCREHKPQEELMRISYNPVSGMPEPNSDRPRSGRGAYICLSEGCIERAKKKHVIERHLKCEPCDTLYTKLEELI